MRSPGDPEQRSRRLPVRVFGATAVVVLAAELGVRALAPALPMPPVWPDLATATKVEQLDRIDACTDVVFVGNSMTRDDLVPPVFTDADPADRSAYNAALDAASPAMLDRWLRDEVLPAADPATVVVGVASFDLNDAASTPAAARRSFDDAPYTADGTLAAVEAELTRRLALVRFRDSLRDPQVVVEAVGDRLAGEEADRPDAVGIPGVLAPEGHGLSRRDLRFRGDAGTVDRLRRQFLEPFETGGAQVDGLRAVVERIEASGADAVVAVLPVTEAYVDAHPDGAADVARFRRALAAAVRGTGATVLDLPAQPRRSFADTHHLNAAGADRLSAALPALLDRAGVPVRHCGV